MTQDRDSNLILRYVDTGSIILRVLTAQVLVVDMHGTPDCCISNRAKLK